jgi:hypothetical protein
MLLEQPRRKAAFFPSAADAAGADLKNHNCLARRLIKSGALHRWAMADATERHPHDAGAELI